VDDKARELREAVARAHKEYMRAAQEMNEIVSCVPSGLPPPEGAQLLTNAAKAERHALDEYMKAMRAFNNYVNSKPVLGSSYSNWAVRATKLSLIARARR